MAAETAEQPFTPPLPVTGGSEFPPLQYGTIYMDGILNITVTGNAVVKVYIYRLDGSFRGNNTNSVAPFAQLVMPIEAFVTTAFAMEKQVQELVKRNIIAADMVERVRRTVEAAANATA